VQWGQPIPWALVFFDGRKHYHGEMATCQNFNSSDFRFIHVRCGPRVLWQYIGRVGNPVYGTWRVWHLV
jgi:hypothetical protein